MTDLAGHTVGVTADRRGEDQVVMFERLGATVILGPTMATVRVPDPDLLRARTEEIIGEPPDYFIANTGIGVRTWMAAAAGWGLEDRLRQALAATRVASRGPKATAALSSAGLSAWWRSPSEQLADVIDHLCHEGVVGRRVALQLHGDDGSDFVAGLEAAGASVVTVPVYLWQLPDDPKPALDLIDRTCRGRVDALTFTAGPQIRSMLDLARTADRDQDLLRALAGDRVVVGCIGPVCASVAGELAIGGVVVPENWRLGSLVKTVAEALSVRG